MQDIPFFSVVIPVYNKGPHIHRSISSVLNQTFQDFELILVNDASTDNSLEEIQKFTDERIRLFQRTEPGPGGYAARNLGIEKAKGEWVAFLDADDEWYPHHLEKMHELAQKYPDVYFMGCGWQTEKEGVKKENAFYKSNKNQTALKISLTDYLKNGLSKKLPVWTSVACVRKSSPVALNLFPASLGAKRGGDLHAWLKMMCYHKEIVWSNHVGAVYHRESINMVTMQAEINFNLLHHKNFNNLTKNLTNKEIILLKKYFNRKLKHEWILGILRNAQTANFRQYLYWKNNYCDSLIFYFVSFTPKKLIKILF